MKLTPEESKVLEEAIDLANLVQQHFKGKTTGTVLFAIANLVAMAEVRDKADGREREKFIRMIDFWTEIFQKHPEALVTPQ